MEAIFEDKLTKILPKVKKIIYLRSLRISSKISKKKYLPRLKTKKTKRKSEKQSRKKQHYLRRKKDYLQTAPNS